MLRHILLERVFLSICCSLLTLALSQDLRAEDLLELACNSYAQRACDQNHPLLQTQILACESEMKASQCEEYFDSAKTPEEKKMKCNSEQICKSALWETTDWLKGCGLGAADTVLDFFREKLEEAKKNGALRSQFIKECDSRPPQECKRPLIEGYPERGFIFNGLSQLTDTQLEKMSTTEILQKRDAYLEKEKLAKSLLSAQTGRPAPVDEDSPEMRAHRRSVTAFLFNIAVAQLNEAKIKHQCYDAEGRGHLICFGLALAVGGVSAVRGVVAIRNAGLLSEAQAARILSTQEAKLAAKEAKAEAAFTKTIVAKKLDAASEAHYAKRNSDFAEGNATLYEKNTEAYKEAFRNREPKILDQIEAGADFSGAKAKPPDLNRFINSHNNFMDDVVRTGRGSQDEVIYASEVFVKEGPPRQLIPVRYGDPIPTDPTLKPFKGEVPDSIYWEWLADGFAPIGVSARIHDKFLQTFASHDIEHLSIFKHSPEFRGAIRKAAQELNTSGRLKELDDPNSVLRARVVQMNELMTLVPEANRPFLVRELRLPPELLKEPTLISGFNSEKTVLAMPPSEQRALAKTLVDNFERWTVKYGGDAAEHTTHMVGPTRPFLNSTMQTWVDEINVALKTGEPLNALKLESIANLRAALWNFTFVKPSDWVAAAIRPGPVDESSTFIKVICKAGVWGPQMKFYETYCR